MTYDDIVFIGFNIIDKLQIHYTSARIIHICMFLYFYLVVLFNLQFTMNKYFKIEFSKMRKY